MSVHSPIYPSDKDDNIESKLKPAYETLSTESSSKHTPESRSQKSPEYAFSVTVPNTQKQNILPSLYFEVSIEFLRKDNDLYLFERYYLTFYDIKPYSNRDIHFFLV